uniref:Ig-like domain-containing protein n=1 Tax=Lates calcarifer TaxID=8187 RepID=A0A4W6CF95_LATCA
ISSSACSVLPQRLTAGDSISPERGEVSGREGQSVTLRCRYETSASGVRLYWYRHHSDVQAPQFILWKEARSWMEEKQINMTISSAAVTDSAVYYCAVRPTVTGNTITLGSHTLLNFSGFL